MTFQVRNKRNDSGTYTLSYGKGGNKLTGRMAKENGKWRHNAGSTQLYTTMKECKDGWGSWAEAHYSGNNGVEAAAPPAPPRSGPPSLPPRSGPPPMPPKKEVVDLTEPQAADPFDPRFTYPSDHPRSGLQRQHTPLGQLMEIRAWHRKHVERLGSLAYGAYKPIIQAVEKCIARECPDLIAKEGGGGTE